MCGVTRSLWLLLSSQTPGWQYQTRRVSLSRVAKNYQTPHLQNLEDTDTHKASKS